MEQMFEILMQLKEFQNFLCNKFEKFEENMAQPKTITLLQRKKPSA
jgi:hypothetical protein